MSSEGMDFYLAKPFRPEEIINVIQRFAPDKSEHSAGHQENQTTQRNQRSVFDREEFLKYIDGNETLFKQLISIALETIPDRIKALRDASDKNNAADVRLEAHTLKGIARQLCACLMADAAYPIEIAGEKGEIETARGLMGQLEQEAEELLTALKREL
ncbi:MAG: hypothetical protein HC887_13440 [Desulfobacteraceae bacterium]|nr:hypothetical protein [Desulfobacteraceae bacterium]